MPSQAKQPHNEASLRLAHTQGVAAGRVRKIGLGRCPYGHNKSAQRRAWMGGFGVGNSAAMKNEHGSEAVGIQ